MQVSKWGNSLAMRRELQLFDQSSRFKTTTIGHLPVVYRGASSFPRPGADAGRRGTLSPR